MDPNLGSRGRRIYKLRPSLHRRRLGMKIVDILPPLLWLEYINNTSHLVLFCTTYGPRYFEVRGLERGFLVAYRIDLRTTFCVRFTLSPFVLLSFPSPREFSKYFHLLTKFNVVLIGAIYFVFVLILFILVTT